MFRRPVIGRPAAAPPSPAPPWRRCFGLSRFRFERPGRFDKPLPVLEHFRRVAVDIEPRQSLPEWPAMGQCPLCARRKIHVRQPALQAQDLAKAFDVAARERQHPERRRRFLAVVAGLDGLKGHRSVGGMRASIYNAFPEEGVDALVEFMKEFERKRG